VIPQLRDRLQSNRQPPDQVTTADDYALRLALERGLLRPGQLEEAQQRAAAHTDLTTAPPTALDLLVRDGVLDARTLAQAVANEFGMAFVELSQLTVPSDALAALPRSFVIKHNVCPVSRSGDVLRVALADPLDVEVLDALPPVAGLQVETCVATDGDISRAIERYYGRETGDVGAVLPGGGETAANQPGSEPSTQEGAPAADRDAPVIKLVHSLIMEAVRRRASDIHLEPLERRFRVRYRIDGVLLEVDSPPKKLQLAIISRVKIMANISIAEKRVPQDGRIQLMLAGKPLDLRVSTLPTAHGESIVMRLLDKEGLKLGLIELGMMGDHRTAFERLIASPDGMLLVTGPTGSGKTTTLYAALHSLNHADRKLITVEDPVEYQITGINQVPVNTTTGMTFAAALRAMLRQAPNIVMVGEIRDVETADIAINASLTGHLVFSTLHTNDAPGAVTRLIEIGVKPFLVSASLRAVLAQRLVRRICPECRQPHQPAAAELALAGFTAEQIKGANFCRGAGCAACQGTGYRGRLGIFELFIVDEAIRGMIYGHVTTARLRDAARRAGMLTMREDGLRKVLAGHTTIDEVLSVTVGDTA